MNKTNLLLKNRKYNPNKAFILDQLKFFGIVTVLASLASAAFGYWAGKNWDSALNGAVWGIVMALMALPILGVFIMARYWGDFAGRWGAARRGEDCPEKRRQEEEDLPPFNFSDSQKIEVYKK